MKDAPSILIIKTSGIGDVILTTPVAEALRRRFPEGRLDWFAEKKVADVVVGNPFLDDVIIWDRLRMRELRKQRRWGDFRRELRALRDRLQIRTYDYCVDLQGFDRTLLIHALVKARRRILLPLPALAHGYAWPIIREIPPIHATNYHLAVLQRAGLALPDFTPPMRFSFTSEDEEAALALIQPLRGTGPLIAINTLTTWLSKAWESERYVDLARRLIAETDARVLLIGGKEEAALCNDLATTIGPGALGIAGATTLKQLAALLTQCRCLITSDSGPMHVAAAVGTPVVALFGPTDPANYGPRGPQHTTIYLGVPCSPCMNKHFRNPSCMAGIETARVYEEVRRKLDQRIIPISAVEESLPRWPAPDMKSSAADLKLPAPAEAP